MTSYVSPSVSRLLGPSVRSIAVMAFRIVQIRKGHVRPTWPWRTCSRSHTTGSRSRRKMAFLKRRGTLTECLQTLRGCWFGPERRVSRFYCWHLNSIVCYGSLRPLSTIAVSITYTNTVNITKDCYCTSYYNYNTIIQQQHRHRNHHHHRRRRHHRYRHHHRHHHIVIIVTVTNTIIIIITIIIVVLIIIIVVVVVIIISSSSSPSSSSP